MTAAARNSAERLWWSLSGRAGPLLSLATLGAFTAVAALAPLLSHDVPIWLPGGEVASPLWRVLGAADVVWLGVVAVAVTTWAAFRACEIAGAERTTRRRVAASVFGLGVAATLTVAAMKSEFHETRRYRAELGLRRELAALDEAFLEIEAPSRSEAGAKLAEYLALNDRSHVALSVSPDIDERIWAFQDGRGETRRRRTIEALRDRNAAEVRSLAAAVFPLNPHAPDRPSFVRMTRPRDDATHALGTDFEGRDLLAQLVWATRTAMTIALATAALAALAALVLGTLAGWCGGWIDWVISRVVEVTTCLPMLFMLIVVAAYLPADVRSRPLTLVAILALFAWPHGARLVRAEAARVATAEYVLAARALGATPWRILAKHVAPQTITPLLVHTALLAGAVVVAESSLAFLGFGVDGASWGRLLQGARTGADLGDAWHLAVFPGLAVFALTLALNVLGEGLRVARDPGGR